MTIRRSLLVLAAASILLAASAVSAGYEEGVAAFKAGNYDQAVAEFQQFVEERPDQHAGYVMLGRSLISARKAKDAVAPLQKALEMNADDIASRVYLGQALYQSGNPRDCISTLNKLNIGGLPKNAQIQVYQMRGASHARLGNTGSAATDLGRLADLQPDDAEARFEYGRMLQNDAQLDDAIAAYERAVSMDGSQLAWKETLVNALKISGRSTQGAGKTRVYARAEEVARSLVGASATFDHLLLLGEVQLGGKNYESAASTFQQAVSKQSNDWHAHYYLGQALTSLERFGDAEGPLNTALGLTSGDDEKLVWKQLGFVFEKQKKFSQSIAAYEKGSDPAGVSRVRENERIARENLEADQHNREVEAMQRQLEELDDELQALPGASNEPPR